MTEEDISSTEGHVIVKRISTLGTKLELSENSEVSVTDVSVSRICDSVAGAALGKGVLGVFSHLRKYCARRGTGLGE